MNSDDEQKKILEFYMEEYKSLRTESLNTINNRISIMGFSFTALALVGSVTVSAAPSKIISAIILGFVLPLLARTVTLVWIGEYQRSQRAGVAIALLEKIINRLVNQEVLTWENTLRRRTTKLVIPYEASIKLFLYISSISQIFAMYYFVIFVDKFVDRIAITVLLSILFSILLLYNEILMRIRIQDAWLDARRYATYDGVKDFETLKSSPDQTDPLKSGSDAEIARMRAAVEIKRQHQSIIDWMTDFEIKFWRSLSKLLTRTKS